MDLVISIGVVDPVDNEASVQASGSIGVCTTRGP
jgi:hypothetical protein